MDSILIKILSWWLPKRRYTQWHCNILEWLIAVLLFLLLPKLTSLIVFPMLDNTLVISESQEQEPPRLTELFKPDKSKNEHPVIRLVQTGNWTYIVLGFYMACILAPINEELLFRGGLQNCLQGALTLLCRKKRRISARNSRLIISIISIILPALIFALIHYRSEEVGNISLKDLIYSIFNSCIAWTFFAGICFTYLFGVRQLRFRDLFGSKRELPGLIGSGVKWIWIYFPVFIVAIIVNIIMALTKTQFIPDPFVLIPLALAFGFLYYRTQSVLPSMTLHFLFNFINLSLVLLIFGL